jgi:hypothetical protein
LLPAFSGFKSRCVRSSCGAVAWPIESYLPLIFVVTVFCFGLPASWLRAYRSESPVHFISSRKTSSFVFDLTSAEFLSLLTRLTTVCAGRAQWPAACLRSLRALLVLFPAAAGPSRRGFYSLLNQTSPVCNHARAHSSLRLRSALERPWSDQLLFYCRFRFFKKCLILV